MRFQCLEVTCGKQFGWTAKKFVKDPDNPTISFEYVICPYCGGLNFEDYGVNGVPKKHIAIKTVPEVQYPKKVADILTNFDPADLMKHEGWKNKKIGAGEYTQGSLEWGWDFETGFAKATIEVLVKGVQVIGGYEFSYNGQYHTVKTKKAK